MTTATKAPQEAGSGSPAELRVTLGSVQVSNFRSLRDVTVPLDPYTVLIGANGAGKSSLLYALDWFFGARVLDEEDRSSQAPNGEPIRVAVDFVVPEAGGQSWDGWVRDSCVRVTREWQGPKTERWSVEMPTCRGFEGIRADKMPIGERRAAYQQLRQEVERYSSLSELPKNASKDDIYAALQNWEAVQDDLQTAPRLVDFSQVAELIAQVTFVLVPASTDLADAIVDGRSSLVDRLTGSLLGGRAQAVCERWAATHAVALETLQRQLSAEMTRSATQQTELVNAELKSLAPGVEVSVSPMAAGDSADWLPRSAPAVHTEVRVRGDARPTAKQGHGIQRAVMMAMLQAAATAVQDEPHSDPETEEDLPQAEAASGTRRTLVVAVEEPEIYQHPQRARQIASALQSLAKSKKAQVLVATHSSLFVRSEQFARLRRFSLNMGATRVDASSVTQVAELLEPNLHRKRVAGVCTKIGRRLDTELTPAVAEAFFADRVLIVEGPTDQLVVEFIARELRIDLAANGAVIIHISKDGMALTSSILRSLGVPTYELFDGDALAHLRTKHSDPDGLQQQHCANTTTMLDRLNTLARAGIRGPFPAKWGDESSVTPDFAVLHDDLEHELRAWPSYQQARQRVGGDERSKEQARVRRILLDTAIEDCPQILRDIVKTSLG